MRLAPERPNRPQFPAVPLANLSLLVFACVAVAGMSAAPKGPGWRFASPDRDGVFDEASAVRVDVEADQDLLVDGTPVAAVDLGRALAARSEGSALPSVLLVVSPDASYEAMVSAYGTIAALPRPPRIAVQTDGRGIGQ